MSLYIDSNSSSATSWLRDMGEAPYLPSLSLPMCKMRVIAVPASWGCCELENCPARYMLRESWSQQSVRKLKLYKHRALQTLGFPHSSVSKESACSAGDPGSIPGLGRSPREDPLEKEMATHSSILAWRIPWTEEPGGLQPMESPRVGHDLATKSSSSSTNFSCYYCHHYC